jgi:hypothetical protein
VDQETRLELVLSHLLFLPFEALRLGSGEKYSLQDSRKYTEISTLPMDNNKK